MTTTEKINTAQLQADDFNGRVHVGQDVILLRDNGEKLLTKTRTRAQLLSGHTPVVWLDGVAGAYHIDRVFARVV